MWLKTFLKTLTNSFSKLKANLIENKNKRKELSVFHQIKVKKIRKAKEKKIKKRIWTTR